MNCNKQTTINKQMQQTSSFPYKADLRKKTKWKKWSNIIHYGKKTSCNFSAYTNLEEQRT